MVLIYTAIVLDMNRLLILILALICIGDAHSAEKTSLNDLAARYGFPSPSRGEEHIAFRSAYTEMRFQRDSRMMKYNGLLIWMCGGATSSRQEWSVSKADAEKVIAPLLRSRDYASKKRKPRLVLIDPGHGGAQTGAKPKRGLLEKKLVLDISLRLKAALAKQGIRCALTRERDVRLTLASRSRKIGEISADLFVSIHMNSAGNTKARGIETYVVPAAGYQSTAGGKGSLKRVIGNSNDELNSIVAYLLQRDMLKATGAEDRGIKRARFDVIANATCPAVLVECGFLSNVKENVLLQKTSYRQSLANGLATGISNYISIWDKK
jgi:N-acetylmuramoyl-L-alanine amidase